MTTEEALQEIVERVRSAEYAESGYVDFVDIEAMRIAIEVLKKQVKADFGFYEQWSVYCDASGDKVGCGASCGYHETREAAIKAWNRRAEMNLTQKEKADRYVSLQFAITLAIKRYKKQIDECKEVIDRHNESVNFCAIKSGEISALKQAIEDMEKWV